MATVHASKPRALVLVSGRERLSFPLRRRGTAYRARVVLPRAGRWRYGVLVGRRTTFVGAVAVLPRRLRLGEPFDVVEQADHSYLIADRTRDAVYRLRGRELRKLVSVPNPRDLEPAPGGRVLIASGRNVLALDPERGTVATVATADNDVLGIARMADGAIVVSDFGSRLLRFDGGRKDVLATGLDGVHGLLATDRGLIVCESSTGRVLRLRGDGTIDVMGSGLDKPSFAAPAGDGALYVSEFGSGRISRLAPPEAPTPVAQVPEPAAISVASDGRLLVASLIGRVARVDPANGRVEWLYR